MPRPARRAWCLLALLAACPAAAQEWSRFRGPNGSGESETSGLPAAWTSADLNWRVALPGRGHSSPVLWGEKLFLTSALDQGRTRVVLCLDARDGRLLWRKDYAAAEHGVHFQNSHASSTPAADDRCVYVAIGTPEQYLLVALSHTGDEQWRAELGAFSSQHGFGTSPIVYEDLVVINNDQDGDSSLVALDRTSGAVRWKTPRKTAVVAYSTPCVHQPAGGRPELIFNSQAHGISGIDPRTGQVNWELEVFDKRSVSSPIVAAGLVFGSCGSGGGGNYVVAVRPGSQPQVAYKVDKSAPYVPTSVARGDLLFLWGDNGIVTCVRTASGEQVWQKRVGGSYSGSPVRVANTIYCAAVNGEVVALAADAEYELLGRSQLGETCRSTPAVAGGRMFWRTESHLASLGKGSRSGQN